MDSRIDLWIDFGDKPLISDMRAVSMINDREYIVITADVNITVSRDGPLLSTLYFLYISFLSLSTIHEYISVVYKLSLLNGAFLLAIATKH